MKMVQAVIRPEKLDVDAWTVARRGGAALLLPRTGRRRDSDGPLHASPRRDPDLRGRLLAEREAMV